VGTGAKEVAGKTRKSTRTSSHFGPAEEAAGKVRKADSSAAEAAFGMTKIRNLYGAPFGFAQGRL
jgi:hypothetical protein